VLVVEVGQETAKKSPALFWNHRVMGASKAAIIGSNRCICGFCRRGNRAGHPCQNTPCGERSWLRDTAQRVDSGGTCARDRARKPSTERGSRKRGRSCRAGNRAPAPSCASVCTKPGCHRALGPGQQIVRRPSARISRPCGYQPISAAWRSSRSPGPARHPARRQASARPS